MHLSSASLQYPEKAVGKKQTNAYSFRGATREQDAKNILRRGASGTIILELVMFPGTGALVQWQEFGRNFEFFIDTSCIRGFHSATLRPCAASGQKIGRT